MKLLTTAFKPGIDDDNNKKAVEVLETRGIDAAINHMVDNHWL